MEERKAEFDLSNTQNNYLPGIVEFTESANDDESNEFIFMDDNTMYLESIQRLSPENHRQ